MMQYKCPLCDSYQSRGADYVRRHLTRFHHLNNESGQCSICDTSQTRLICHIANAHVIVEWVNVKATTRNYKAGHYLCDWCPLSFTTKANSIRHAATIHQIGVTLKCVICDYANFRKDVLREHYIIKHSFTNDHSGVCPARDCGLEVAQVLNHLMNNHL